MEDIIVIGTLTLPGEDRAVRSVRAFVRDMLPMDHPALDDVQLCAAELFTNALRHTRSGKGGRVTLTLGTTDTALALHVIDDGTLTGGRPHRRPPSAHTESGRGLLILEALSTCWGHHPDGPRTTVWAHFTPSLHAALRAPRR